MKEKFKKKKKLFLRKETKITRMMGMGFVYFSIYVFTYDKAQGNDSFH